MGLAKEIMLKLTRIYIVCFWRVPFKGKRKEYATYLLVEEGAMVIGTKPKHIVKSGQT